MFNRREHCFAFFNHRPPNQSVSASPLSCRVWFHSAFCFPIGLHKQHIIQSTALKPFHTFFFPMQEPITHSFARHLFCPLPVYHSKTFTQRYGTGSPIFTHLLAKKEQEEREILLISHFLKNQQQQQIDCRWSANLLTVFSQILCQYSKSTQT